MEIECLMCRAKTLNSTGQHFCPVCQDSYTQIEICMYEESLPSPDRFEKLNFKRGSKVYKTKSKAYDGLKKPCLRKESDKSNSNQNSKGIDISTDDQSSLEEGLVMSKKVGVVSKLVRNSKKINKVKNMEQYNSNQGNLKLWKVNYLENPSGNIENSNDDVKANYSSLGNKNCENFQFDSVFIASISEITTDSWSKSSGSEALEICQGSTALKNSDEKLSKPAAPLNPIDLVFDDSFDEEENDPEAHATTEMLRRYQPILIESNEKINTNQQELKTTPDKIVDFSSNLLNNHSLVTKLDTVDKNDFNLMQPNGKNSQQLDNLQIQRDNQTELNNTGSDTDEIMIGEQYQCSVPPLVSKSQMPVNQRRFKLVSDPSAIDPKIVEMVESYVSQHLNTNNISSEKLLKWLSEFDYKIPEFFIEVLRDKEKSKKRITWRRERGRLA